MRSYRYKECFSSKVYLIVYTVPGCPGSQYSSLLTAATPIEYLFWLKSSYLILHLLSSTLTLSLVSLHLRVDSFFFFFSTLESWFLSMFVCLFYWELCFEFKYAPPEVGTYCVRYSAAECDSHSNVARALSDLQFNLEWHWMWLGNCVFIWGCHVGRVKRTHCTQGPGFESHWGRNFYLTL